MEGLSGSGRGSPRRVIEVALLVPEREYTLIGCSIFLRAFIPRSTKDAGSLPTTSSRTAEETTIPPG
jgi:hypothetical protein